MTEGLTNPPLINEESSSVDVQDNVTTIQRESEHGQVLLCGTVRWTVKRKDNWQLAIEGKVRGKHF